MAAVAHLSGDLRGGLDRSVHRPCHRGQAALVLQGRAVPAHRATVVAGPSVPAARHRLLEAYHHAMLNSLDLYDVRGLLTEDERAVQDSVGRFVDERVLPVIQDCFEKHVFPKELIPELADLGLLGSSIHGYDCAGLNAVSYGLICQELERGDSGIRSFVSVQSSLCMYPIYAFGT